MDVWNYILGYRNTLKSVFETWVVHIPFNTFTFRTPIIYIKYNFISYTILHTCIQFNIRLYKKKIKKTTTTTKTKNVINKKHPFVVCN